MTATEALAQAYMEVVPKAMREFRQAMRFCRDGGLSIPQLRILGHLRRGPRGNRELADYQGISIAAMSRAIDALCREGWVEKTASNIDRRKVSVTLTPAGRRRLDLIRNKACRQIEARLQSLSSLEAERMSSSLLELSETIEAMSRIESR